MSQPPQDDRPGLAIVSNVMTPYRLPQHRRIMAGVPEFKLHSIFTHQRDDMDWEIPGTDDVNPVSFGRPGDDSLSNGFKRPIDESRKANEILAYFKKHNVRAAIVAGYRDMTRVRVIRGCKRLGIPVFLRSDSNLLGDIVPNGFMSALKAKIKAAFVRWIVAQTNGVMPVGSLGRKYFLKYGADPDEIFWLPLYPDYEYFEHADDQDVQRFREEHQLPADRKYLIFSGRLVPPKRVDLLIDAFNKIARDRPEWNIAILGNGKLEESLRKRVDPAIRDRVHWLGFMQIEGVKLAYHACDALVLPSDYEPWALVVNEAMTCGLPVVASDVVGAAADMITDGEDGMVFKSGNLDSLITKLLNLTTPGRIQSLTEKANVSINRWRRTSDPSVGLRQALSHVGLLDTIPATTPATGSD